MLGETRVRGIIVEHLQDRHAVLLTTTGEFLDVVLAKPAQIGDETDGIPVAAESRTWWQTLGLARAARLPGYARPLAVTGAVAVLALVILYSGAIPGLRGPSHLVDDAPGVAGSSTPGGTKIALQAESSGVEEQVGGEEPGRPNAGSLSASAESAHDAPSETGDEGREPLRQTAMADQGQKVPPAESSQTHGSSVARMAVASDTSDEGVRDQADDAGKTAGEPATISEAPVAAASSTQASADSVRQRVANGGLAGSGSSEAERVVALSARLDPERERGWTSLRERAVAVTTATGCLEPPSDELSASWARSVRTHESNVKVSNVDRGAEILSADLRSDPGKEGSLWGCMEPSP